MAVTQIRGSNQIKINTIALDRLVADFLGGVDWDITNGANDATITGLASPVNSDDAATKGYVDGLIGNTSVFGEAPTVTNGSPTLSALANTPVAANTQRVYLNGVRQKEGGSDDYTIVDATGVITFTFNLTTGDVVLVDYEY